MSNEAVYFLIHEINENLATALSENLFDEFEGRTRPAKRIDEREGGHEASVPDVFRIALFERLFECNAAFYDNLEV